MIHRNALRAASALCLVSILSCIDEPPNPIQPRNANILISFESPTGSRCGSEFCDTAGATVLLNVRPILSGYIDSIVVTVTPTGASQPDTTYLFARPATGWPDTVRITASFAEPGNLQVIARAIIQNDYVALDTALVSIYPRSISLIKQPKSTVFAFAGGPLELALQVRGMLPLHYQWYRDGLLLAEETDSVLLISQVRIDQAGSYSCEIWDNYGDSLQSPAYHVTIATPPQISIAGDTTISTSTPCSLRVAVLPSASYRLAVDTAPSPYTWDNAGIFAWTPTAGDTGAHRIVFSAVNTENSSIVFSRAVTVTVSPHVNARPAFVSGVANRTIAPDSSLHLLLKASDPDTDSLIFQFTNFDSLSALYSGDQQALQWSAAADSMVIRFSPKGKTGVFTFRARVSDGVLADSTMVAVTVARTNRAPVAADTSVATKTNTPVSFRLRASDPDGDSLRFTLAAPRNGTVSGNAPAIVYTPKTNFTGTDTFTYTVSDGALSSSAARVTVTVTSQTFTLVMDSDSNGTTIPAKGPQTVAASPPVSITAVAKTGFRFLRWTRSNTSAVIADSTDSTTTVTLTGNSTVKANFIAFAATATPVFSPAPKSFDPPNLQITITCATSGSTIRYTLDGSEPDSSSTLYAGPITITSTTTVKAVARANGYAISAVGSATYTLKGSTATPTFSPAAGYFDPPSTSVTISCATTGSTIYYTTDGSVPTTSSAVYSAPIAVTATTTMKAIATAPGSLTSGASSATYTLKSAAATPTFSPAAGYFDPPSTPVTISCATSGSTIRYTTDNSDPSTSTTAATYTGPITVSATTTIKTIATAPNFLTSAVATATYTLKSAAATPTFSPAAGYFDPPSTAVTISCATTGSTIYYTTDGTAPTTTSTVYSDPITVSATTTIKAIATAPNYLTSAVATAAYTLKGTVATPAISPAAGYFDPPSTSVTISCATTGSTIYYTTDGTAPTTSSTVYSDPITVSATTTIKAIATAPTLTTSATATATYTLKGTVATPSFAPVAGYFDPPSTSVTISCATTGSTIYYTTDGSAPTTSSTVYSEPIAITATTTIKAVATAPNSVTSATATGTYTLKGTTATPVFSPAEGYFDPPSTSVTISCATTGSTIYYTTDGSAPTTASTVYSGPIAVSATTTIKAVATAPNSLESAPATATYTMKIQAPQPTFNRTAGTYQDEVAVTINCTDAPAGTVIHYTTDGNDPTATSSPTCAPGATLTAFTSTTTLRAIAVAPNYLNSGIASATYIVNHTPVFSKTAAEMAATVGIGNTYSMSVTATDPDGGTPTVTVTAGPSGMTYANGTLTWWAGWESCAVGQTIPVTLHAQETDGALMVDLYFNLTIGNHVWTVAHASAGSNARFAAVNADTVFRIDLNESSGFPRIVQRSLSGGTFSNYAFSSDQFSGLEDVLCDVDHVYAIGWNVGVRPRYEQFSVRAAGSPVAVGEANVEGSGRENRAGTRSISNGNVYMQTWYEIMGNISYDICKNSSSIKKTYDPEVLRAVGATDDRIFCVSNQGWYVSSNAGTNWGGGNTTDTTLNLIETDGNNGDTCFMMRTASDAEIGLMMRCPNTFTGATFDTVFSATSINPVATQMISGHTGWVLGKDGKVYFTNNAFATALTAESITGSPVIQQIFLSADRRTIWAYGGGVLYR